MNLANSLLYQGKFEEARGIYLEIKDEYGSPDKTMGAICLEVFTFFEERGITHPDVAKIRDLLNEKR